MPSARLATEMTRAYIDDTDRLGLGRPDHGSAGVRDDPEIIALIEDLIAGGHAYESGGDVYFRGAQLRPRCRKALNRRPDDMDQGEEAGTESLKEDRLDFALWKAQKEDEDTAWESPWGMGRPGWHIECSAMAEKLLGLEFAVHGGGSDLVFPHHENEIAQSEAAHEAARPDLDAQRDDRDRGREDGEVGPGNIFQLSEALDRFGSDAGVRCVPDLRSLPPAARVQ